MESLDRNTLNTEIVQLRHEVQRVKTLVLRNLVRKADQLRSKKGKEQIRVRNEKKAERLLQEIHELKNVKPDAVTKFAIKNSEKDCLKTIANAEAPTNVKCLARIACEKSFVLKLKTLEDKYYNWQDATTFLLPVKKCKKKKIKTKKEVSVTGKSAVSENDDDSGEDSQSDPNEESSSDVGDSEEVSEDEDISETGSISPAEVQVSKKASTSRASKTKEGTNKTKNILTKSIGEVEENSNLDSTSGKKEKLSKQNNSKSKKLPVFEMADKSVAVVRKIRNLEDLEQMEHKNKSLSSVNVGEARKDSFFLSADGEEVESEPEAENSSAEEESDEDLDQGPNQVYHSRGREGGYEHRRTFGALNNQETYGKQTKNFNQKQPQLKRFESKDQSQRKPATRGKSYMKKDEPAEKPPTSEKLHPSWEAKRKLKEALQISSTIQNKKIKFDD